MLSPRLRRITRAAGAASVALTLIPAAAAASSSGHSPATTSSGGASAAGVSQTAMFSDGHRYPGDSRHLGDRILHSGMSGHDVRVLQGYLTQAGFPTAVVGHFGPTTKRNVIRFQRAHHLRANGLVTWSVAKALRSAVGASQTNVQTSTVAGSRARISNGLAIAPADAPASVRAVIAAGNRIAFTPYVWGGGHGSWNDSGYDCSGSVSYALHGGGLLSSPEDSGTLESYGRSGPGTWITIWANGGHVYMYVAGLRFDTSAQGETGGSRWTRQGRSNSGYVERHPSGL
ncbi:MAG: peptidoglycan-binding protein [Solirubrobacteraceae bacterium]